MTQYRWHPFRPSCGAWCMSRGFTYRNNVNDSLLGRIQTPPNTAAIGQNINVVVQSILLASRLSTCREPWAFDESPLNNIAPCYGGTTSTTHRMSYPLAGTQNQFTCSTWWRHQMETFSALLALGAFPAQRPVTRSLDDWVYSREAGDWRRNRDHYDVIVMENYSHVKGSLWNFLISAGASWWTNSPVVGVLICHNAHATSL